MPTDEQLVEQLRRGKTRALDELYRRYAKSLYAFCLASAGSKEPEDVVHDVFMRVIESADSFDADKASFRTWIYRIARNRCIDLARHNQKFSMFSLDAQQPNRDDGGHKPSFKETLADQKENPEQLLSKEAGIEAVHDCIDALQQQEERQAIALYYLAGKVYREIAEMLHKSTSTAKNYVGAAQEKVKRCLEGKGF
ncbi:MAG: RNA polymerase sigma factor [bacterium]|nr:RNA polymerase sigma factor [bacterium]